MLQPYLQIIRLGWKWLTGANTPAYYATTIITTVKRSIVYAPEVSEKLCKLVDYTSVMNARNIARVFNRLAKNKLACLKNTFFCTVK
jgi:hypothetical protein